MTQRLITVGIVLTVLMGGVVTGSGVAQQGPPGNGPSGENGPPAGAGPPVGVYAPELVVTNVSVNAAQDVIAVEVANAGKRSVSVELAEIEAVQNETVVRNVFVGRVNVTSNLAASTTDVVAGGESVEVLKDINFDEESAITQVAFESGEVGVVESVEPTPAGVVTSITPATRVVENISAIHSRPSESRDTVATEITKSIEYVRDPTSIVGDAIEWAIVGEQRAPVYRILVDYIDVVGSGDWTNGTVVGSLEVEAPHDVVDFVNFQVTDRAEFLQRHEPGTGTDPTPFKERVEVIADVVEGTVVGKLSWTPRPVVRNVTVLRRQIPVTETSVWDVPRATGDGTVTVAPRESATIRLELTPGAKLEGTGPDLATALVVDGWFYDGNGNELAHFLADPGT